MMNLIVNLYKPAGITSQQAVTKVKRILAVKKGGHTGTLDPLATGILLVCLGEATKASRFLLDMDKRYRARVRLGQRTDTFDAEGRVIEERDISSVTEGSILRAVERFSGRIRQKPPMYSAIKISGQALHRLARRGIEVERPLRTVEVYHIEVVDIELPFFDMTVSCSKGTYVRSLCDDIGAALGVGAHLAALERTGIGSFDVSDSVTFDELERGQPAAGKKCFHTLDEALAWLPDLVLEEEPFRRAKNGVAIKCNNVKPLCGTPYVRLKSPSGLLFGLGRRDAGIIHIERIFNL